MCDDDNGSPLSKIINMLCPTPRDHVNDQGRRVLSTDGLDKDLTWAALERGMIVGLKKVISQPIQRIEEIMGTSRGSKRG